jgi:circadian clock protein KaiC
MLAKEHCFGRANKPLQKDTDRRSRIDMADNIIQPLERVPTGIEKLDLILNGGFLKGGTYMILGTPGAGKTIFGNQTCFNHVARGGRAVFMTLLAETHARMLAHIQYMCFFDPAPIGDSLYYVSGYTALERDGLSGLLRLIRQVLRERNATILVLDGLATAEAIAERELDYRRFLHELQVYVETTGCTAFLLTQPGTRTTYPEHTMVDGLIELTDGLVGPRAFRELEVSKFRGSSYLRGRHAFEITSNGLEIHPRTETVLSNPPITDEVRTRMAFGVKRLDDMLHGGVLSGSATTLLGAPGSGKTVLGLHFLTNGALEGQQGLYFGFYETPPRLIAKATQLGLPIDSRIKSGMLDIIWQAPLEDLPDALAERLLEIVRRKNIKRLFLDGIESFQSSLMYHERSGPFFVALMNELRALNVTTLLSSELPDLFSPRITIPLDHVSSVVDNIIFLRYVELHSQLYRLISIMKVRESGYDPSIREFRISEDGIHVADTFESAEAILTGIARPIITPTGGNARRISAPDDGYQEQS